MNDTTSTSTETGAESLTEESAIAAMAGLMDDDGNLTGPPTKKRAPAAASEPEDDDEDDLEDGDTPDDEDDEGQEDDSEDEADDSDEEDEAEDEEEDGEDDEDDGDAPELSDEAVIPVKIDGKIQRLTLAELKKGYSRTAVFTQRTQEAAKVRQEAEQYAAQLAQERAQIAAVAAELEARWNEIEPEPDWEKLRTEDPVEWAIQKQVWAEKQTKRAQLKAVEQELMRRNQTAQQAELEKTIAKEREALFEKIPEWKRDSAKATKEMGQIREYMKRVGFADEEIGQIYDHRAVLVLRSAMKAERLAERQKALEKTGKPVKVIQKTLVPGKGKGRAGPQTKAREAMAQLRKTGRQDDAARAIIAAGLI